MYKAFISYSHAADGLLAPALQRGLQSIAKPFYQLRAMRIFRDETSLHLTPELWPMIKRAISESEHFVLMASPTAAESQWVQDEISERLRLQEGKVEKFHIVLTEGDIVWDKEVKEFNWEKTTALPKNLQGCFKSEPFYLDFRWARQSEHLSVRNPQFLKGVGKLAAAVRDENLDTLIGEDVRQHRVFKLVAGVTIILLSGLLIASSGAAYYANEKRKEAIAAANNEKLAREEEKRQREEAVRARNNESDARGEAEKKRKEAEDAVGREKIATDQAIQAAKQEETAKNNAEEKRKEAERQQKVATSGRLAAQSISIKDEDPVLAFRLAESALSITPTFAAERALHMSLDNPFYVSFSGNSHNIHDSSFSPDGKLVVTASYDSTACIWDLKTGRKLHTLNHHDVRYPELSNRVEAASFSPDGRLVVTSSVVDSARIWDVESGKEISRMTDEGANASMFFPDSKRVLTASSGFAQLWDMRTQKVIYTIDDVTGLPSLSSDGKLLVGSSNKGDKIDIWDADTGVIVQIIDAPAGARFPTFSKNRKLILSTALRGFYKNIAEIWDVATGKSLHQLRHDDSVISAAFSPDEKYVITGSEDGTARLWDTETGKQMFSVDHGDVVSKTIFSPDGILVLTATNSGDVRLLHTESGQEIYRLRHNGNKLNDAKFSRDGKLVLTCSKDGTARAWNIALTDRLHSVQYKTRVQSSGLIPNTNSVLITTEDQLILWDMESRKEITSLKAKRLLNNAVISPDGKHALTVTALQKNKNFGMSGIVQYWDLENKRELYALDDQQFAAIDRDPFSKDGRYFLTMSQREGGGEIVHIWNAATGREVKQLDDDHEVADANFSPDGKWVVTTSVSRNEPDNNGAQIWDAQTGKKVRKFRHPSMYHAVFSPDGRILVTNSSFDFRVWNIQTGQRLDQLGTDSEIEEVTEAIFTPDGRFVVISSEDGAIRFWNIRSKKVSRRLNHRSKVTSMNFSPDGKRLLTASWDKSARIWEVDTGREFFTLKRGVDSRIDPLNEIRYAAYSVDGTLVLIQTAYAIYVFPASYKYMLHAINDLKTRGAVRSLTKEEQYNYEIVKSN